MCVSIAGLTELSRPFSGTLDSTVIWYTFYSYIPGPSTRYFGEEAQNSVVCHQKCRVISLKLSLSLSAMTRAVSPLKAVKLARKWSGKAPLTYTGKTYW